jgi:hypothetical protein
MLHLLFWVSLALARTESFNSFEKTYARDNTYCVIRGDRLEVMIRGESKFTEPDEAGYGEFLFYRKEYETPKLLPLNQNRSDSFHFFKVKGTVCSKSHAVMIDKDTLALLLLKENKPFKDKLVIQHFDTKKFAPKKIIETDYPTSKVIVKKEGFSFKTHPEIHEASLGKVKIKDKEYVYHEKKFPQWIEYSKDGLNVSRDLTYRKLPWRSYFKDQKDFEALAGWNKKKKIYVNTSVFLAVSYGEKSKCVLFTPGSLVPTGKEAWVCQAMKAE